MLTWAKANNIRNTSNKINGVNVDNVVIDKSWIGEVVINIPNF